MHKLFLKINKELHLILINLRKLNDSKQAALPQHNESETSEELHYLTLNAYERTSPAGADYESTAP